MGAFVVRTDESVAEAIFRKLNSGSARMGWSYRASLDLREIMAKAFAGQWDELDGDQQEAWYCHGFMDRAFNDDLLFYPNVPTYGQFCVVKLGGPYEFLSNDEGIDGDFRSARTCELITRTPIDKTDKIVPPILRTKLGLQRRFYQLYIDDSIISKFLAEIKDAGKDGATSFAIFADMVGPLHVDLAQHWSKHFPRANLSRFLAELLLKYGERVDLREGPGEKGSDLIVEVINDFVDRPLVVGIQVGSYTDVVGREAVKEKLDQLLKGWTDNTLDFGALVLTGRWDDDANELLANHNRSNPDRKVKKIDGEALARIVTRMTWLEDI